MYVNPFWFGVICTIGTELLLIIGWAMIIVHHDNKK